MLAHREKADRNTIVTSLSHFLEANDPFEVRALNVEELGPQTHTGEPFKQMHAGFANKIDVVGSMIAALANRADGVYFTPQKLSPKVFERAKANFLPNVVTDDEGKLRTPLTHDEDVTERRYFIIDVDPVKAKGFKKHSATDAEKGAAAELVAQVREFLTSQGWPTPLVVDSGNGYHLYYKLSNPFAGGKVDSRTDKFAALLRALKAKFDTPGATIDQNVFNASRIMRIPGTWACKGPNTIERPHRLSAVLEVPPSWAEPVADSQTDFASATLNDLDPDGQLRKLPEPKPLPTQTGRPARQFSPLDAVARARLYLAEVPAANSGENGHNHTFTMAQAMVRGFGLSREEAIDVLMSDFVPKSRADDRWLLHEIEHKVDDAFRNPNNKEFGWLLNADNGIVRSIADPADAEMVRGTVGGTAKGQTPKESAIPPATGSGLNEAEDDPHRIARIVLAGYQHGDDSTLVYWRGQFHEWLASGYRTTPDKEFVARLNRTVRHQLELAHRLELASFKENKSKGMVE